MKNYMLIKLPNTINWYSEGKSIIDLMYGSKPIITNHTLDSLLRVGFQKSIKKECLFDEYFHYICIIIDNI